MFAGTLTAREGTSTETYRCFCGREYGYLRNYTAHLKSHGASQTSKLDKLGHQVRGTYFPTCEFCRKTYTSNLVLHLHRGQCVKRDLAKVKVEEDNGESQSSSS